MLAITENRRPLLEQKSFPRIDFENGSYIIILPSKESHRRLPKLKDFMRVVHDDEIGE